MGLQFEFTTKHEQDFFDGKKLLKLNFTNKFFSVQDNYKWANSLLSSIPVFVIADIIKKTTKTPEKIRPLPDTLINKIACSHIRIVKSDSLLRNKRSYDIVDIYLNKATLFPVYAVHDQQGYISKGGVSSDDVFRLTERSRYLRYDFNTKRKIDLDLVKIPADFITLEAYNNKSSDKPLPLLSAGSKAPEWRLQDTKGNSFSSNSIKNKVLLIDFFGNYCAPCIMSLPVINRLHERYKDADVEIVSVDLDNGEEALKFAAKYNMKYPVYVNGKTVANDFHVSGIPAFYLIDKQGNVVTAYDGYSEDLEKNLITQIDKLK